MNISQLIISGTRSLAASFPIAASISQFWSEHESRLRENRFNDLFSNLDEQLSTLEDSVLDKDFLKSEEFFEILRTSVEAAIRTASDYKREYIDKFLAGTIKRGDVNDLSQQIAEDIKELQDFYLHILDYLPTKSSVSVNSEGPMGMLQEVYYKGCTDLTKMGFI